MNIPTIEERKNRVIKMMVKNILELSDEELYLYLRCLDFSIYHLKEDLV